jgi:hypothetical protein
MMPESIAAGKRVKYRNDPLPKLQSGLLKEYFINQDIVNSCALLFFSLAFISTALGAGYTYAILCAICCKSQMRFAAFAIWCPTRNCYR